MGVPVQADRVDRQDGWQGWGDWLGTGNRSRSRIHYRRFRRARSFARRLGLKTQAEWLAWGRGQRSDLAPRPPDIPLRPEVIYAAAGWAGWEDWLRPGLGEPRAGSLPYAAAQQFAAGLGLRSRAEWRAFCRDELPHKGNLPADVPKRPDLRYAGEGWSGWRAWLGTSGSD